MSVSYQLLDKLGSGGFGTVYKCTRDGDSTKLAKKILEKELDEESIKRFRREVEILAKLNHKNIVKVIDCQLDKPPYYYVMPEYRTSLEDELPNLFGDEERIQVIFSAILNAVEYAHSKKVLHRDIKPMNVLMNDDKDVVVTDFGLGIIIDPKQSRLTTTGAQWGTLYYLAPEAMSDFKNTSEQSDIYSLGKLLYELYTEHLTNPFISIERISSSQIAAIVQKCTHEKRDKRFQNMAELQDAWVNAVENKKLDSTSDDLKRLAREIKSEQGANPDHIKQFLKLMLYKGVDRILKHECMMQVSGELVGALLFADEDDAQAALEDFCEHVEEKSWGYSYTDKIAGFCRDAFYSCEDKMLRARLISSVLDLGVRHNRFFVLGVFKELMVEVGQDWNQLGLVCLRLNNMPADVLKEGYEQVKSALPDRELRMIFGGIMPPLVPQRLDTLWDALLDALQHRNIPAYSVVNMHVTPKSYREGTLILEVDKIFFQKTIESKSHHIAAAWRDVFGGDISILVVVKESDTTNKKNI